MKISEIKPGMQFKVPGLAQPAMVVAIQPEHPVWPHLSLVIWKMPDGFGVGGKQMEFSFDALAPHMELGEPLTPNLTTCTEVWKKIMIPGLN